LINPLKRKEYDNLLSLRNAYQEQRDYTQRTEARAEAAAEVRHYCKHKHGVTYEKGCQEKFIYLQLGRS
jgi:hypothetical protein